MLVGAFINGGTSIEISSKSAKLVPLVTVDSFKVVVTTIGEKLGWFVGIEEVWWEGALKGLALGHDDGLSEGCTVGTTVGSEAG